MNYGGRIVNIGSVNSVITPFNGGAVYSISKVALIGLTKSMARDLAPRKTTVNNIQPGSNNTKTNPETGEFTDELKQFLPLNRYGTTLKIASLVMWLLSDDSAYMTGSSINMDGGVNI